jgi:hypothetical protein
LKVMLDPSANEPVWRGLREPRLRQIVSAVALSFLVHLVLTPLAGLVGAFATFFAGPHRADTSESEQLRSIPITFLGYEEDPSESGPPPGATPPDATEPKPGASVVVPSAETKSTPPPVVAEPRAAPPVPKPTAKPGEMTHPVAMAGVASEVVDSNANVNLLLYSERVREHPLGARIGKLLLNFPQWSSFFASGEIDPVRDLNRILVVGPQFRRSADVVAILEHRLSQRVLKAAVDRLVQRPPRGHWLHGKMLAALAHADRAERLFAFTAPDILVVAPPHLEKQIMAAPPTKFPKSDGPEALVVHIKAPSRAIAGLPFSLPESLAWVRLEVLPVDDGGAELHFAAEDSNASSASSHAQSLSAALNAVTNPDLGALGALVGLRSISFIDKVQFRAKGNRIVGQVRVTPRQLDRLLAYAEEMIADWSGRRDALPGEEDDPVPRRRSNAAGGASQGAGTGAAASGAAP